MNLSLCTTNQKNRAMPEQITFTNNQKLEFLLKTSRVFNTVPAPALSGWWESILISYLSYLSRMGRCHSMLGNVLHSSCPTEMLILLLRMIGIWINSWPLLSIEWRLLMEIKTVKSMPRKKFVMSKSDKW